MLDRRQFVVLSAASLLGSPSLRALSSSPTPPPIARDANAVHVRGENYEWIWSQDSDIFQLIDKNGRTVVKGPLQPAITILSSTPNAVTAINGWFQSAAVSGDRLVVRYASVNYHASLQVVLRFHHRNLWLEPVVMRPQSWIKSSPFRTSRWRQAKGPSRLSSRASSSSPVSANRAR